MGEVRKHVFGLPPCCYRLTHSFPDDVRGAIHFRERIFMLMICPVCKQISTFRHFYEMIDQYIAPVVVSEGKVAIDYDNTHLETVFDDDQPEVCTCDKCENDVQVDRIKVVHE